VTKQIVTLKRLAEIIGKHRNLVAGYQLRPDYIDENGHEFWTLKTAARIAEKVKEYRKGSGKRVTSSRLKQIGLKQKREKKATK
jgi:RPA family protein